jgi:hypothetical protein
VHLGRAVQQQQRRSLPPTTPLISAPLVLTRNGLKPGKKRVVSGTAAAGCAACSRPCASARSRRDAASVAAAGAPATTPSAAAC